MLIWCWHGYSAPNIWLGRSKSWYFSTNEIFHNGHFFILNNFMEFMTFIFSRIYFIFALFVVQTLYRIITAWHLKGKELEQLFWRWFQPRCFFSVNRCVIRTILLCLATKTDLFQSFGNEKIRLKLFDCLISEWFKYSWSRLSKWCTPWFSSPWSQFEGLAANLSVTWNKVAPGIFEPFCALSASQPATMDTFIKVGGLCIILPWNLNSEIQSLISHQRGLRWIQLLNIANFSI